MKTDPGLARDFVAALGRRGERTESCSPLLIVLLLAASVFMIYGSTFAAMTTTWLRSSTYAHGALIIPISAFLLFRERQGICQQAPAVHWWAVVVLAAIVSGWIVGALIQVDVVQQLAMVGMIPAFLLLVLGPAVMSAIAFPVFFAVLAVPMGDVVVGPLMDLTANGSVALLRVTGVSVHQDGWLIRIAAGDFQVADACSGARYLIGAVTFGVLFSHIFFSTLKKRLFFMCFIILLAVMSNVLRAYIIIILAHLSDTRLAVGVDHFVYGWLFFLGLLLVASGAGLRFADARAGPVAGAPVFMAAVRERPAAFASAVMLGMAMMVAGPLVTSDLATPGRISEGGAVPPRFGTSSLISEIQAPDWLRAGSGWLALHLLYTGEPPFQLHIFRNGPGPTGRDVTALRDELATDKTVLLADDGAEIAVDGGVLPVRRMRLRHQGSEITVAYWFVVGARQTANPVTAKLMELATILRGEHKASALVAVAIDAQGLDQPDVALDAVVGKVASSISKCLNSHLSSRFPCPG